MSDDPNRISGGTARAVLDYLVSSLVGEPDEVHIETKQWRGRVSFNVSVDPDDMGRLIGRKGRTASALRTVVRAAGSRDGVEQTFVDILE